MTAGAQNSAHGVGNRAVGLLEFGGPEVLQIVDLPIPTPGEGEIRVRVEAAAVSPTDTVFRAGAQIARMTDVSPPYVPGMDLAGVVDAVGPDAPFRVGDRVMAVVVPYRSRGGAQAQYVIVPGESAVLVPDLLSLDEAATLPMNGLTAQLALDRLDLQPGAVLGVTGAAGTLGGYVIQIAKHTGLRIIADASSKDEALVREYGADVVVERGERVAEAFREACPAGLDAMLDGALLGDQIVPAVRDGGKLAIVRPNDVSPLRDVEVVRVHVPDYLKNTAALNGIAALAADGVLKPRIVTSMPFTEVVRAHEMLAAGGLRGRIVLTF